MSELTITDTKMPPDDRIVSGCDCRTKINALLAPTGMKLTDKGSRLSIIKNVGKVVYTMELDRLDGKKKTIKDAQCIAMTNCPFCGVKF